MSTKIFSNLSSKPGFSAVNFVLGLTIIMLIVGAAYYYTNSQNPESFGEVSDQPNADGVGGQPSGESNDMETTANTAIVRGTLCYPSEILPIGEIVFKNIATQEMTYQKVDGSSANYEIMLEPGTYIARYQAYIDQENPDQFSSGYFTNCAMNPVYEICSEPGSHEHIPIVATAGQTIENIDLCDFYYEGEIVF